MWLIVPIWKQDIITWLQSWGKFYNFRLQGSGVMRHGMHGGPPPTTLPCDPETQGPGSLGAMVNSKFGIFAEYLAGGIFHFWQMEYSWNNPLYSRQKWNIPHKVEYSWEYSWNKFLTQKIYSIKIPLFQGVNFTFQPVWPRKPGLWHSAPLDSSCPHQHPGSPPKGASSPPFPGEKTVDKWYSTNIPLFPLKGFHLQSLILGACVGIWGG